jgi:hypothetical protein
MGNMSVGTCKLCKQVKRFAKAHIIPRSFFLGARGGSKHWSEARQGDAMPVAIWQNGVWDEAILCTDCDNSFSPWDDYGFKVLGNPPGNDLFPKDDSDVQPFVLKDIDYGRLKLFVLSVLWRASVSSKPFFARIQLGKHEATIADMIQKKNPGSCDQFPVVIGRLVCQQFPNAVFPPRNQRSPEGVNFNLLFLPSIKIMVKVDRRPLPQALEPIILKPQRENLAMPFPLHVGEILALQDGAETFRTRASRR